MAANKKTPPGLQQSNIIMPHILRLGLHPTKEGCFLLHKWGCGEERREKKPEGRYGIFIYFYWIPTYHMISQTAFEYSPDVCPHACVETLQMDFKSLDFTGQLPQKTTAGWGQLISSGNTLRARLVGEVTF